MSSKKYKGKTCVHCCNEASSDTGDHVFARSFFLETPKNIPIVPACAKCNGDKAALEHYATTVLPFGGRHPDASLNLSTRVPPRLEKNSKLHSEMKIGQERTWAKTEAGMLVQTTALPLDFARIEGLFQYIIKGLTHHHFDILLPDDFSTSASVMIGLHERLFWGMMASKRPNNQIANDLGNGTFVYEGFQGRDYPELTVWRFKVYGGLQFFSEDPLSSIMGLTARRRFVERISNI